MAPIKTKILQLSVFIFGAFILSIGSMPVFAGTSDDSSATQSPPLFIPGLPASISELLWEDDKVVPTYQQLPNALKERVASLEATKSNQATSKTIVKKVYARAPVLRNTSVVATAYSSTPDQTDSSPCITANGFNVCKNNIENVIAANFLPFGTHVRLPDLYGDRIFVVRDRMNARYKNGRIDVWMKTRAAAKQFGVKRSTLEVVDGQIAAL